MDEIKLKKFKLCLVKYYTEEMQKRFAEIPKVTLHEDVSWDVDAFMMRVIQPAWGRQVVSIYKEYPKDWIEAFKDRWFPKWARRKWPVQYETIKVDIKELYRHVTAPGGEISMMLEGVEINKEGK